MKKTDHKTSDLSEVCLLSVVLKGHSLVESYVLVCLVYLVLVYYRKACVTQALIFPPKFNHLMLMIKIKNRLP